MSDGLKACPGCGEQPEFRVIEAHRHTFSKRAPSPDTFVIECYSCAWGMCGASESGVRESWNRRAESPEVERLRAECEALRKDADIMRKRLNELEHNNAN